LRNLLHNKPATNPQQWAPVAQLLDMLQPSVTSDGVM